MSDPPSDHEEERASSEHSEPTEIEDQCEPAVVIVNQTFEEPPQVEEKPEQKSEDRESEHEEHQDMVAQKGSEPEAPVQGSIIAEVQKQWIIKKAEEQRIGVTQDFFQFHMNKYNHHLKARSVLIQNVVMSIQEKRQAKKKIVSILKGYFEEYGQICEKFHEKSYKYEYPQREESQNRYGNIRVQMRQGLERMFSLRRDTGQGLGRLTKMMRGTILNKLDRLHETYLREVEKSLEKMEEKRQLYQDRHKDLMKRVDKVGRVYLKGRIGQDIKEDVFVEMLKFVRDEAKLRLAAWEWGRGIIALRRDTMRAEFILISELQGVLGEFKQLNDGIYRLRQRKYSLIKDLKQQIQAYFRYEKLCTPVDIDYILSVFNFKNKTHDSLISEQNFETFLNEDYFNELIGPSTQFLKGTTLKTFPLQPQQDELVQTASNNLVCYNKRTMQVRFQVVTGNTRGEFRGQGMVQLREEQKGIIFDSVNRYTVRFRDNNRAEQILLYLQPQLQMQQI